MIKLFDTHCHLDVTEFDADRDAILARVHVNGVTQMLVPAVNRAGWCFLLQEIKRKSTPLNRRSRIFIGG